MFSRGLFLVVLVVAVILTAQASADPRRAAKMSLRGPGIQKKPVPGQGIKPVRGQPISKGPPAIPDLASYKKLIGLKYAEKVGLLPRFLAS